MRLRRVRFHGEISALVLALMLALASLVKTRLKGRYAPALGDFSFGVISMTPVGRGQNEIEGGKDVCENTRHL